MPKEQKKGLTRLEARRLLQKILDDRKWIEHKSEIITHAFEIGAKAVESRVANGAKLRNEAIIMRYHANNPGANLIHDKYTRQAIEVAIHAIDLMIARSEEK